MIKPRQPRLLFWINRCPSSSSPDRQPHSLLCPHKPICIRQKPLWGRFHIPNSFLTNSPATPGPNSTATISTYKSTSIFVMRLSPSRNDRSIALYLSRHTASCTASLVSVESDITIRQFQLEQLDTPTQHQQSKLHCRLQRHWQECPSSLAPA